jgi:hypothetical protein
VTIDLAETMVTLPVVGGKAALEAALSADR